MNIQTLKKWKENGLLEAALDGKLQVKIFENWKNIGNAGGMNVWLSVAITSGFDLKSSYDYRIKPEFECGDIIKTKLGDIYTVLCVFDKHLHLQSKSLTIEVEIDSVVKVKRILKPHTFETAVKDCAENGFELKDSNTITGLKDCCFWVNGCIDYYKNTTCYSFPNDKPFCQVEYEECE